MSAVPRQGPFRLLTSRNTVIVALLWTALVGASLTWNILNKRREVHELASKEAMTTLRRDLIFRGWVASHGGIYVEPRPDTPPNPYLAYLPDRDVVTTDGKRLTLLNGAYIIRLLQEFAPNQAVNTRLTSLKPMNPTNAPDAWEAAALTRQEKDRRDVIEVVNQDGQEYVRAMRVFVVDSYCMKCHAHQGYKLGDIRGGISVRVSLEAYTATFRRTVGIYLASHGLLWLCGIGAIGYLARVLRLREGERREAESRMRYLAHYDALTCLPNRTLLHDRLRQALTQARRNQTQVAVLFIDLDRFKHINDSLGHNIGDMLLKELAGRLEGCIRETDSVSRQGGDEFIVLLPDVRRPEDAGRVAEKIMGAMSEPFAVLGQDFVLSASIGVSFFPDDGDDPETLLKHADTAMYRAKDQGGGAYQYYEGSMNARNLEWLKLEQGLRQCVAEQHFLLHYQPQIDMASGRIIGAEALIRWRHPEMGMVPPDRFIPIAEETGLIRQIGLWVLRTAALQAAEWTRLGYPLRICVNLSAHQLRGRQCIEHLHAVLLESGLAPGQLEMELTESTLMSQREGYLDILTDLRQVGVRLAVDDFGTGYSSLAYLKRFPIDTLKIDRSFVRDIPADENDLAIIRAMISLADSLNLVTVAEGVETAEQARILLDLGCATAQGYYYSRPVEAARMGELLAAGTLPIQSAD